MEKMTQLSPPTHLLEAKEYLKNHGINVKTKMFKNCEHKIPVEGSSLGLGIFKKKSFIIKTFFNKLLLAKLILIR